MTNEADNYYSTKNVRARIIARHSDASGNLEPEFADILRAQLEKKPVIIVPTSTSTSSTDSVEDELE